MITRSEAEPVKNNRGDYRFGLAARAPKFNQSFHHQSSPPSPSPSPSALSPITVTLPSPYHHHVRYDYLLIITTTTTMVSYEPTQWLSIMLDYNECELRRGVPLQVYFQQMLLKINQENMCIPIFQNILIFPQIPEYPEFSNTTSKDRGGQALSKNMW